MHSLADNNSWSSFLGVCEPNSLTFIKEPLPTNEKTQQENEINSFKSASQVVDIDLIDCHEISSMCDLGNDISAIDSYFRKRSSSLENLDFMSKPKTKLPILYENGTSPCGAAWLQNQEEVLLGKSVSVGNLTSASTRASHHQSRDIIQRHSVHFTTTRCSPFSFDFFHIRNLNERAVMLSIQFVIDKRLPSSLTVHEDKLQCLAGDSIRSTNMATFIPLATGAYTITIFVVPLWKKRGDDSCHQNTFPSSASAIVVRCHLNVIDVPIGRPLTILNGSTVIKLSSFIGLSTRSDVLFQLSPEHQQCSQMHQNLRPYTLLFELSGHSELITFSSTAPHMPTAMKWRFVNLWTCSITFRQPSDFVLPMQMKCTANTDSTPVVLSISTANDCGKALHTVQNYQITLNAYPTALLNRSLIQASTEGTELTADQWKRIDLRNKDPTRLVHVKISATLADEEVKWPCWQCTAAELTLPPLAKTTIGVYVSRRALAEATLANDGGRAAVLKLNVQQSAGEGTRLTSVLPLRAICIP